jgi:beta-1,4-N-acetylglucosaminyltransferase
MTKIGLICSSGGHLYQLYSLRECFQPYSHFWVSFSTEDAKYLLRDEKVYWAYHPTHRNLKNFAKNCLLARKVITREKPDYIVTTGAGVGVSFVYVASFYRIKTVYLESFSRIEELSLSGKLVYPFADFFLVQWRQLAEKYSKAIYRGKVV